MHTSKPGPGPTQPLRSVAAGWRFLHADATALRRASSRADALSSSRAAAPSPVDGDALDTLDEDTAALLRQSRSVRTKGTFRSPKVSTSAAAEGGRDGAQSPTDALTADPTALSTDEFLDAVVRSLQSTPGVSAAFTAAASTAGEASPLVKPSVLAMPSPKPPPAPISLSSAIADTPPRANNVPPDPPIVWKDAADDTRRQRASSSAASVTSTSAESHSSLFPNSHALSRAVRTAAPKPMRFGVSAESTSSSRRAAPTKTKYGSAWFVPPTRWRVPGPDGSASVPLKPKSVSAAEAERKEMDSKLAHCRTTLSHLEVGHRLAEYSAEAGRVMKCLSHVKLRPSRPPDVRTAPASHKPAATMMSPSSELWETPRSQSGFWSPQRSPVRAAGGK